MSVIIDSYSEANQDADELINGNGTDPIAVGQSFTGKFAVITSTVFYLRKFGTVTGNAYAKIYAHSGTFGVDGLPTGSALATSDPFDVSVLTTSYALSTFNFSGANQITLANNTKYFVIVEYTGAIGSNWVRVGYDSTSPTALGSAARYISSWISQTYDVCFYVYGDLVPSLPFNVYKVQGFQ